MNPFRQVTAEFWASPQIGPADLETARALGIAMVVNNRPDGEAPEEPQGETIERAARDAGIAYRAIPVAPGGFTDLQVEAMARALQEADGPVLAYCRSGTRSTFLWSLAQAAAGREPADIAQDAAGAGYDVAPIEPLLIQLAQRARA